jgi:hypothetical protein
VFPVIKVIHQDDDSVEHRNDQHVLTLISRQHITGEFVAEFFPDLAIVGIAMKAFQSLGQYFSMPIGDWNVFGSRGYVVPEGLHIIDLLVDRESIKTGWWQW